MTLLDGRSKFFFFWPVEEASKPYPNPPSERGWVNMNDISIRSFKRYCKQNFKIDEVFRQIKDRRKRPQIKTSQIIWAVMNMVGLGIKSLLELDQLGRLPKMRSYIGTTRCMVASDSTYERVLNLMPASGIRRAMVRIYQRLQAEGADKVRLESGKKLCAAGIDASGFGRHLASVLSIFGKTQLTLDIEPYLRKGKELPSSYELIKRATRLLGKAWCDILVGDGLYKTAKFFRLCKKGGFDGLVKTREVRLQVIQDALGLFKLKDEPSIERRSGFDLNRLCDYQVESVGSVRMRGLRHRVKVVHVKEYYPKKDRHEEFFVITTKNDLTALEARELAHRRWIIENNIFRQLSQIITSKRIHTHNQKVLEPLLLLWYIGLNLLSAFLLQCLPASFRQIFGMARETISIKITHMRLSLISGHG
jgi:hypothetical protein